MYGQELDPYGNIDVHDMIFNTRQLRGIEWDEAIVLLILQEWEGVLRHGYDTQWKNEGIPCSGAHLANVLYCTIAKQQRIMKSLKKKGIIQTKIIGIPPVRHYKINDDVVSSLRAK